ncbi:hypothetical protein IEQ34_014227 [Dendrobium chrysotoxum]|uniref:Uncharacterized protein n=1 Tax=Dendrobium chrysotoxum TaxID=161865 RepID=A0AAV7GKN6_DENCH|nr:hypothetical protein IEQ34_014227 [Dendrobium chrysotoxum]
MDKLLAMSILSAGPDYSAGNWWLSHLPAGGHLKKKEVKNENEKHTSGNRNDSNASKYSLGKESKENKARFGMEFDGLNCFETIISY